MPLNYSRPSMPRLLLLLCAVAFLAVFSGCVESPEEPLRVGLVSWPPHDIAVLAQQLGFYDSDLIRLVDYQSHEASVLAYEHGLIDVLGTTTINVLELETERPGNRVILLVDESDGADALVARPGIESIEQLRGRRVGIEIGGLGLLVLNRALHSAGMSLSDVEILSADQSDHQRYVHSGRVDAVVTYEPVLSSLREQGGTLLFDSSQMSGEIIDVFITREEILDERQGDLQHFVDGWFRALEYFQKNPQDAASRVARRQKVTPQELLESFRGIRLFDRADNVRYFTGDRSRMENDLRRLAGVAEELGLTPSRVDVSRIVEGALVQR